MKYGQLSALRNFGTAVEACLATRAASSQRNGKREVQEGAVDTEHVPLSLLSKTSDGTAIGRSGHY